MLLVTTFHTWINRWKEHKCLLSINEIILDSKWILTNDSIRTNWKKSVASIFQFHVDWFDRTNLDKSTVLNLENEHRANLFSMRQSINSSTCYLCWDRSAYLRALIFRFCCCFLCQCETQKKTKTMKIYHREDKKRDEWKLINDSIEFARWRTLSFSLSND